VTSCRYNNRGPAMQVVLVFFFFFWCTSYIHTLHFLLKKPPDTKKNCIIYVTRSWRRSRIWSDDELLRYKSRVFCSIGSHHHHHHHHTAQFHLLGTLELALLQWVVMAQLCSHGFWGALMITLIVQTNKHGWCGRWVSDQCCSGLQGPSLLSVGVAYVWCLHHPRISWLEVVMERWIFSD
jgi:hypothetical protein